MTPAIRPWRHLPTVVALCLATKLAASPVYRVTPSADLTRVEVEVRLPAGAGPLTAPEGRLDAVLALEGCDAERVASGRGRIHPPPATGCLRYSYPLNPQSGRRSPPVARGVVISTPGEWLWRPAEPAAATIRIELTLPPAMAASVPWRPVAPGVYELGPSPGSATAMTVFGAFHSEEIRVGDTGLRLAAVDGPALALDLERIRPWLVTAAEDVAGVGGSFPSPAVQVIVQPVESRGRSPVPFGYVIRDGGETVRFFVDPRRALEDYLADWTATHEFAHLLLPYVGSREKWVSEGFASYYQNVLLARRGIYTPEEAWTRLHTSFTRARQIEDPPPPDELHERAFREVRMLVYWSGAALALMADTALRDSGDGMSLDVALGRLADCCLPSERVWKAEELFARLDSLAGRTVFMPLYRRLMKEPGMPELGEVYADLGLEPVGGTTLRLAPGRLSAVRDAIMAPKD